MQHPSILYKAVEVVFLSYMVRWPLFLTGLLCSKLGTRERQIGGVLPSLSLLSAVFHGQAQPFWVYIRADLNIIM